MIKIFTFFLLFLLFIPDVYSQTEKNYREGELLIQLDRDQNLDDFKAVHPEYIIETVSECWKIYLIKFGHLKKSGLVVSQEMGRSRAVSRFQKNHKVELRSAFPDDPQFGTLWGLHNTGQNGGVPDADIDAPEAWGITTGGLTSNGDTIVVAVIDDGFQVLHKDLDFWINHGEIPDNGIDDDGNGYVDDYYGWNVYDNTGTITSNQHGTHVAGIIGARGNNGLGVTGVNWNVKIMAVQGSSHNEATVIRAYSYVFEQRKLYDQTGGQKGAFVVATNASFGVDGGQPFDFPLWCAVYDSLGSLGILNAGATANRNLDIDVVGDMPTGCVSPFLISVTNTTRHDNKNTGAAYGLNTIELGAPGTQILSTVPTNSYTSLQGTSMATPHVAGTIALMWAAACPSILEEYKNDPAGTALLMKNLLLDNVDPIAALQGKTITGGRLNAHKALLGVIDFCGQPIASNIDVCVEEPFLLIANPRDPDKDIYWYHDPTQGHIHIGDTLSWPGVVQDETFYIAGYDTTEQRLSSKVPVYVKLSVPNIILTKDITVNLSDAWVQLSASGGVSYSWSPSTGLSDTTISNPIATPTTTTTYSVTVTDKNNCTASDSVKITVLDNTNVEKTYLETDVKVFPVPSTNQVNFEFSRTFSPNDKVFIEVLDIMGRVVKNDLLEGNNYSFHRNGLPAGLYWYRIEQSTGTGSVNGKIVFVD